MKTNAHLMSEAIGFWMKKLDDIPNWRAWNRQKLRETLSLDDPWPGDVSLNPNEFIFPDPINREHAVIMSYLGLVLSLSSLRDCEFYFRRYPFRGLPISHDDHLRYICEMYFGRFYEFKERIKVVSDAAHSALPGIELPFGALIKDFAIRFKPELKQRHHVHHHGRFEDARLDNIGIISRAAAGSSEIEHLTLRMRNSYRAATKEWAERVRDRSGIVEIYLDSVAAILIKNCPFLNCFLKV